MCAQLCGVGMPSVGDLRRERRENLMRVMRPKMKPKWGAAKSINWRRVFERADADDMGTLSVAASAKAVAERGPAPRLVCLPE